MSTTTAGAGATDAAAITDVTSYASAVRRHLVGLTPEQVEDLTDDLEADLTDTLADSSRTLRPDGKGSIAGDLVARFGEPAAYAAELRAAAGLPEAGAPAVDRALRARLARAARSATARRERVLATLRAKPWWEPVAAFVISVRPVGWVVRGWVVFQVFDGWRDIAVTSHGAGLDVWPRGLAAQLVLVALVVVSVQWGRGFWQPGPWGRRLRIGVTAVAVLAALPVLASIHGQAVRVDVRYQTQTLYQSTPVQDGVVVGGMAVSNLFVYDADGNPLEDVQIYDDRGRPVRTTADDGSGQWALPGVDEPWTFQAVQDEDGRTRWNVYPLHGAPSSSFEWDQEGNLALTGGATTRVPPRPFAKAPAVTAHVGTGSSSQMTTAAPGSGVVPDVAPTTDTASADPSPTTAP